MTPSKILLCTLLSAVYVMCPLYAKHTLRALKAGQDIPAELLIEHAGIGAGLVVLVEPASPKTALDLARTGKHVVLVLLRDYQKVESFDAVFSEAGVLGAADAKLWLEPDRGLPLRTRSVNAVLGDHDGLITAAEIERVLAPGYGVGYHWNGKAWDERRVARPEGMDTWTGGRHTDSAGHYGSEDTEIVPPNTAHFISGPNNMSASDNQSLINVNERVAFMGMHSQDAFSGVTLQDVGFIDAFTVFVHGDEIYEWDALTQSIKVVDMITGAKRSIAVGIKPGEGRGAGSWSRTKRFRHDGERIFMTDGSKKLYCFNMLTGAQEWVQEFDHHVDMIATDAETLVATLVTDQSFPHEMTYGWRMNDGQAVVALDRKTGEERWRNTSIKGLPVMHLAVEYGAVVSGGFIFPPTLKGVGSAAHRQADYMRTRMHAEVIEPDTGKTRWFRDRFEEHPMYGTQGGYVNNDLALLEGVAIFQSDQVGLSLDLKTGKTVRIYTGGSWKHTYTNAVTPHYYFFANKPMSTDGSGHVNTDLSEWRAVDYYTGYRVANGMLYGEGVNSTNDPRHAYTGWMALSRQAVSPAFDDSKRLIVAGNARGYKAPDPADWYTFRGNAGRDAWLNAAAPTKLSLAWEQQLPLASLPHANSPLLRGWHANSELPGPLSQPSTDGNTVLVAVPDGHRIEALDLDSGKRLWSTSLQGRTDAPPTIAGEVAYVGTNDGMVTALDLKDGKIIWQFFAGISSDYLLSHDQIESLYYVPSSPVVLNNIVYVTAGRHSSLERGVVLWGLDPVTGAIRQKMLLDQHSLAGSTNFVESMGLGFTNDTLQVVEGALRINDYYILPATREVRRKSLNSSGHMHVFPTFNTGIKQGGYGWIRPVEQWSTYGAGPREFVQSSNAVIKHSAHLQVFSMDKVQRVAAEHIGKKGKLKNQGVVTKHQIPRVLATDGIPKAVAGVGDVTYAVYREGDTKNIPGENLVVVSILADGSSETVLIPVLNGRETVIPDGIAIVEDTVIITTTLGRVLALKGAKSLGRPVKLAAAAPHVPVERVVNQAVIAQDDSATTEQNVPVQLKVLANDRDPEGEKIRIGGVVRDPQHGTLKRIAPRKRKGFWGFMYYPNADFTGTDRFEYSVGDGYGPGTTSTAQVTITVKAAENAAPTANDDQAVLYLDQASQLAIGVTLNDTDPNVMDHLHVSSLTQPQQGRAVIEFNTVVYTPKTGFQGRDQLSYTITDGKGNTATANVAITVEAQKPKKKRK